ncbi:MAG: zinc ribbon domain-containing protein [Lachnospiraceae bacterium]|nr:zinc ribbon domain-containing protein [Lachnospiraceae bacterium]
MKCTSCGADIGLTDEKCPYCGRVVTETKGYQTDLKDYKEKNKKTKRRLTDTLSGNIPIVISAVVMVALLAATGVAGYVKQNAYRFRSDAMRKESVKKYDEYSAQIKEYLEAGDYTGFAAFMEYHNIAEWEAPYDDLNLLWEIASDYNRLVSEVESSVLFGPEADRYRPEEDVSDCRRAIREFYDEYADDRSKIETDPYGPYINDMKKKADIVLRVYLGLDEAALESYLASSDIEQESYLEGVIIDE